MKRALVVPLLLVAGFACTDDSVTSPEVPAAEALGQAPVASARAEVKTVPFKLQGDWWYADGDPSICDGVEGTASVQFIAWEGTATHLGPVSGSGVNCYGPGDPLSRTLLAQIAEFHAANGDALYAFGEEATVLIFPDFSFEIGPVDFNGGTGRFENAVGWYRLYGDDAIGAGPFTLEGEISSVGSAR